MKLHVHSTHSTTPKARKVGCQDSPWEYVFPFETHTAGNMANTSGVLSTNNIQVKGQRIQRKASIHNLKGQKCERRHQKLYIINNLVMLSLQDFFILLRTKKKKQVVNDLASFFFQGYWESLIWCKHFYEMCGVARHLDLY